MVVILTRVWSCTMLTLSRLGQCTAGFQMCLFLPDAMDVKEERRALGRNESRSQGTYSWRSHQGQLASYSSQDLVLCPYCQLVVYSKLLWYFVCLLPPSDSGLTPPNDCYLSSVLVPSSQQCNKEECLNAHRSAVLDVLLTSISAFFGVLNSLFEYLFLTFKIRV